MDAKGEAETGPVRLQFDRSIKLEFRGSSISSDGGLLLHRELDDALGLTDMAAGLIGDPRTGRNGRHRFPGFLRQSLFSRLAGLGNSSASQATAATNSTHTPTNVMQRSTSNTGSEAAKDEAPAENA